MQRVPAGRIVGSAKKFEFQNGPARRGAPAAPTPTSSREADYRPTKNAIKALFTGPYKIAQVKKSPAQYEMMYSNFINDLFKDREFMSKLGRVMKTENFNQEEVNNRMQYDPTVKTLLTNVYPDLGSMSGIGPSDVSEQPEVDAASAASDVMTNPNAAMGVANNVVSAAKDAAKGVADWLGTQTSGLFGGTLSAVDAQRKAANDKMLADQKRQEDASDKGYEKRGVDDQSQENSQSSQSSQSDMSVSHSRAKNAGDPVSRHDLPPEQRPLPPQSNAQSGPPEQSHPYNLDPQSHASNLDPTSTADSAKDAALNAQRAADKKAVEDEKDRQWRSNSNLPPIVPARKPAPILTAWTIDTLERILDEVPDGARELKKLMYSLATRDKRGINSIIINWPQVSGEPLQDPYSLSANILSLSDDDVLLFISKYIYANASEATVNILRSDYATSGGLFSISEVYDWAIPSDMMAAFGRSTGPGSLDAKNWNIPHGLVGRETSLLRRIFTHNYVRYVSGDNYPSLRKSFGDELLLIYKDLVNSPVTKAFDGMKELMVNSASQWKQTVVIATDRGTWYREGPGNVVGTRKDHAGRLYSETTRVITASHGADYAPDAPVIGVDGKPVLGKDGKPLITPGGVDPNRPTFSAPVPAPTGINITLGPDGKPIGTTALDIGGQLATNTEIARMSIMAGTDSISAEQDKVETAIDQKGNPAVIPGAAVFEIAQISDAATTSNPGGQAIGDLGGEQVSLAHFMAKKGWIPNDLLNASGSVFSEQGVDKFEHTVATSHMTKDEKEQFSLVQLMREDEETGHKAYFSRKRKGYEGMQLPADGLNTGAAVYQRYKAFQKQRDVDPMEVDVRMTFMNANMWD